MLAHDPRPALRIISTRWLPMALALASSGCNSPSKICDPGRTVACACLGGLVGVQSCADDGAKYGACTCPTPGMDAGVEEDAGTADTGLHVLADAGQADTGNAAATDGGLPLGSPCTYPDSIVPTPPTSGFCDGNAAVVCDESSHLTVKHACAAGETCQLVQVDQVARPANPASPAFPHQSYTWATCVATGAEPCAFTFSDQFGEWMPTLGVYVRCATDHQQQQCTLPLPQPPARFPSNAGTPDGFWLPHDCLADETCRAQNGGTCTVGDKACTAYSSSCESDATILYCENAGDFPVRGACPSASACRLACDGLYAGCYPNSTIVDPDLCVSGTPNRCTADRVAVLICGGDGISCFQQVGKCVCSDFLNVCTGGTKCMDRKYADGTPFVECGWDVDCKLGNRCDGTRVIRCDNDYPTVTDCALIGMDCAADANGPGCVAGTETCLMTETPGCKDSSTVDLCCPVTGLAFVGTGNYPCVPGRRFTMACPTPPMVTYQCQAGRCVH